MPSPLVNKNPLDVSQIFQTWITFGGDVRRTSVALNIDEITIENLIKMEGWGEKLKQWNEIKDGGSQDAQVALNRAINLVQAHRIRSILDKIIGVLSSETGEQLVARFTVANKNGGEFKARCLTDLVKAVESAQLMTARALGDTAANRPDPEGKKGSSIALNVLAAMNAADASDLGAAELVRQELGIKPTDSPRISDAKSE